MAADAKQPDLPYLPSFAQATALSLSSIQQDWICLSPDKPVQDWSKTEVKRLMNLFSWRNFISSNWPVFYTDGSENGLDKEPGWEARRTAALGDMISEKNLPRWMTWKKAAQILDGQGTVATTPDTLQLVSRLDRVNLAKGEGTGFAGPMMLYDLNGKKVHYEIRMNDSGADYVQKNSLYTLQGQTQFAKKKGDVFFQSGQCKPYGFFDIEGIIETKLAWKIMGPGDIRERFLRRTVQIQNEQTGNWEEVEVGLVGMHLSHKTRDYMKWVWSTFEQIDNVQSNPLPDGAASTPSFYNLDCSQEDCPVNCPPEGAVLKSQLTRTKALKEDVIALNTETQQWLQSQGSVLQYYQLVETQYVPIGSSKQTPLFVRNTVMEPYLTKSSCDNIKPSRSSCIGCHNQARVPSSICDTDPKSEDCVSADLSFIITEARNTQAEQAKQAVDDTVASADAAVSGH